MGNSGSNVIVRTFARKIYPRHNDSYDHYVMMPTLRYPRGVASKLFLRGTVTCLALI